MFFKGFASEMGSVLYIHHRMCDKWVPSGLIGRSMTVNLNIKRTLFSISSLKSKYSFSSPLPSTSSYSSFNRPSDASGIISALKAAESVTGATNPQIQADLYEILLKAGYYNDILNRYNAQPQLSSSQRDQAFHIQSDPACISPYLSAARNISPSMLNQANSRVREILNSRDFHQTDNLNNLSSISNNNGYSNYNSSANQQNRTDLQSLFGSLDRQQINNSNNNGIQLDPREFKITFNNPNNNQPLLRNGSKRPALTNAQNQPDGSASFSIFGNSNANNNNRTNGRMASGNNRIGSNQSQNSVNVVLTEVYTWKRYAFTLFSRILVVLLLVGALSYLVDQPGILKNGLTGIDIQPDNQKQIIRFVDVQGCDEAKSELEEVVDFLKNPNKFLEIGGRLPRGILLYGPPGTGKTHLARAVAGEADVPFFQMSGSEFDELYVGVGARRVRDLFATARKHSPCIIFIDEIDAVGSKRNSRDQSHMRQTLNQLLTELDGFHPEEGIIFIGATNTPEALDKALTRPGRMDKLVPVPLPDVTGRSKILQVHLHKVRHLKSVDPTIIARGTPGLSGADLANLVNQAAVRATRLHATAVRMEDLEWAKDKIQMGAERKSAVISTTDKRRTAVHEGGHTIAALYTPGATPLHKVTVMPRGNALGLTHFLPEADQHSKTKEQLDAQLVVAMGGLAAEELMYGKSGVTTGPAGDLKTARSTAIDMILTAGMSEKIGFAALGDDLDSLSPDTRAQVELEVKHKLDDALKIARDILKSKRKELDLLSDALVLHETLTAEEVKKVVAGKPIISIRDKLKNATDQVEQEEEDIASTVTAVAFPPSSRRSGGGRKIPSTLVIEVTNSSSPIGENTNQSNQDRNS